jgi:hypothetical protein
MICPRVPVEATNPVEKLFSYPWLIKIGKDIKPIVTTVAPTMPVLAASKAPTIIIDTDNPPLIPLKAFAIFSSIFAAIPDFSRIVPIKINRGTASNVTLFIIPKILIGILLKIVGSKISKGMQINANIIDTPARVSATGKPNNNAAQIINRSRRGTISIFYESVDIRKLKS